MTGINANHYSTIILKQGRDVLIGEKKSHDNTNKLTNNSRGSVPFNS